MMNQVLMQYSYLQVLDFLTTTVFLLQGLQEANPMVRLALHWAPTPLGGLLLIKVVAVGLGLYCWKVGKQRLLSRVNILFAVVVAWNLAALVVNAS